LIRATTASATLFSVPVRLFANHPWKPPGQTVWTFWGNDEAVLRERLSGLGDYGTKHYGNREVAALVLRRDDKLGTIEGGWTRDAVRSLIEALPEDLADLREELEALFAPSPRADQRKR
jgi:hypothetical protein